MGDDQAPHSGNTVDAAAAAIPGPSPFLGCQVYDVSAPECRV
jgi:hypothetical protein